MLDTCYKIPEMLKNKKYHLTLKEEMGMAQKAKLFKYPYNKEFQSRINLPPYHHSCRTLEMYSQSRLIRKTLDLGSVAQGRLENHTKHCGLSEILNIESWRLWSPSSNHFQKCSSLQFFLGLVLWLHSALLSLKFFCLTNFKFKQDLRGNV